MTGGTTVEQGGMRVDVFAESLPEREKGAIIPKLIHGADIVTLVSGSEDVSNCDALITENRALTLGIRTADCAPICVSDGKWVGIAHVGWRGLCSGLIEKILGQFESATLSVYVGPFLHSFEIKKDLCYDQIVAKFGVQFFREEKGRIVFNFKRAVESLLPSSATFDLRDTATNPTLPSYRRDKTPVRLVTTVRLA